MNFTFEINGENWQTIENAFERIVRKVNSFSPTQLSQQNGLPHFVIFAESDNKKRTFYDSLEGFGHAFSLITGGHSEEEDNRCFECLNHSRKKKNKSTTKRKLKLTNEISSGKTRLFLPTLSNIIANL
jgi:hypothetical protein